MSPINTRLIDESLLTLSLSLSLFLSLSHCVWLKEEKKKSLQWFSWSIEPISILSITWHYMQTAEKSGVAWTVFLSLQLVTIDAN